MQALVLAAGVGNRIAGVSEGLPKSFLKLGGETLIERNLRMLRAVGVSEIVIVTGYQRERFRSALAARDVRFAFNPFYDKTNVLTSFWCGAPYLTDDFIYLHADTVFDKEVLTRLLEAEGDVLLACDTKRCAEEEMKYRSEGGRVVEINKTMSPEDGEGEFLGVCKFSEKLLDPMREISEELLAAQRFEAFFEVAIQELIDRGEQYVEVVDVADLPWCEIDFPEDYETAKRVLTGR